MCFKWSFKWIYVYAVLCLAAGLQSCSYAVPQKKKKLWNAKNMYMYMNILRKWLRTPAVSLSISFFLFCCSHSHSVMGPAFASTRNRATSHDHKWSQDPWRHEWTQSQGIWCHIRMGRMQSLIMSIFKVSWMAAVTNVHLNSQSQILDLIFGHL